MIDKMSKEVTFRVKLKNSYFVLVYIYRIQLKFFGLVLVSFPPKTIITPTEKFRARN